MDDRIQQKQQKSYRTKRRKSRKPNKLYPGFESEQINVWILEKISKLPNCQTQKCVISTYNMIGGGVIRLFERRWMTDEVVENGRSEKKNTFKFFR